MLDRSVVRRWVFGLGTVLALTSISAALAGGFYLIVESPASGSSPQRKGAVLIVRPDGCIRPTDATLSATAEGLIKGDRKSVPVRLTTVSPGVYAVKRQWPQEGTWVLAITGRANGMTCSRLVPIGPGGEAPVGRRLGNDARREAATRTFHRKATAAEIDAVLQDMDC